MLVFRGLLNCLAYSFLIINTIKKAYSDILFVFELMFKELDFRMKNE